MVLIGVVLVPNFDRMEPPVCYWILLAFPTWLPLLKKIDEIMLCLVDLVLFSLLSEIFFDRTLL